MTLCSELMNRTRVLSKLDAQSTSNLDWLKSGHLITSPSWISSVACELQQQKAAPPCSCLQTENMFRNVMLVLQRMQTVAGSTAPVAMCQETIVPVVMWQQPTNPVQNLTFISLCSVSSPPVPSPLYLLMMEVTSISAHRAKAVGLKISLSLFSDSQHSLLRQNPALVCTCAFPSSFVTWSTVLIVSCGSVISARWIILQRLFVTCTTDYICTCKQKVCANLAAKPNSRVPMLPPVTMALCSPWLFLCPFTSPFVVLLVGAVWYHVRSDYKGFVLIFLANMAGSGMTIGQWTGNAFIVSDSLTRVFHCVYGLSSCCCGVHRSSLRCQETSFVVNSPWQWQTHKVHGVMPHYYEVDNQLFHLASTHITDDLCRSSTQCLYFSAAPAVHTNVQTYTYGITEYPGVLV